VRVGCQECSGRHMEHGMLAYGSATTRWDGYMGPFFSFCLLSFICDDKTKSRQAMIRITTLEAQTDAMIFAS